MSSLNMYAPFASAKRSSSGFTLLELLIAVLLSSIVILVVGSLFLANSNTFRATDDSSRLQENGRFALQTISRIVRQAGYTPGDVVLLGSTKKKPVDEALPANLYSAVIGGNGATIIAGADGKGPLGASPNASDSLTVQFFPSPGGQTVDCFGVAATPAPAAAGTALSALPTPVVNTFFVQASPNGGNSLFCTSTYGGVSRTLELIPGVESLQVLYAVSAGGSSTDVQPNYYTSAKNLSAAAFNNVVGIQVGILLMGAERATVDQSQANTVLNPIPGYDGATNGDAGAVYTISAANEKRTFRVLAATIGLRNAS
jgi:type IV pilus assembly protein PilW